jgi:hypothetical protein|tara:strand:- start:78 stop:731 length:654 start_codon:yes stop_codon:yes gene_type:complete
MIKWNSNIKNISFFVFLIPTITVILSYIFSLYLSLVPSCIPVLDGCTSISRTGRYYPVNIFFKTFMFLSGFLILFYWYENYLFFKNLDNSYLIKITYIIGIISIIFLFLYLVFLGENNYYRYFRKIGIFIYLVFSIISELLLSIIYYKSIKKNLFNNSFVKFKLILCICMLTLGLILFPFMVMKIDNVTNLRNIISWNYFLLIQINFLLTFLIWKKN